MRTVAPGEVLALVRRLSGRAHGWLARALHDLALMVEQAAAEEEPPSPDVLAARLRDQLDREPTHDELLLLLSVVDRLCSALTLSDSPAVRTALASYAEGLRRTLAG